MVPSSQNISILACIYIGCIIQKLKVGGFFKGPEGVISMEGDFAIAEEEVGLHINIKEAVALENSL